MKRFFALLLLASFLPAAAQTLVERTDNVPFGRLDGGIVLGTTGIGLELSTPLADFVQLRAGFSLVPTVQLPLSFAIPGADAEPTVDEDGELVPSTFDRLSGLLQDMTGCTVDDQFDAVATPHFRNLHVMADFRPLRSFPQWHLTAGFLWGTSNIGTLVNAQEEAPLLVALSTYNRLYDKAANDDPLLSYGDFDLYNLTLNNKLLGHGRLGVEMGQRTSDGSTFVLEPDEQGVIRATMQVNAFKPYLGTGFEGCFSHRKDGWRYAIDLGALFWGGAPRVVTTDHCRTLVEKEDEYGFPYTEWEYSTSTIDLVHDVQDVPGRPGEMLNLVRRLKVYPVIELRLTHRLF